MYPLMPVELLAFHDRSTVCWSVAPVPLAVSEAVPPPLTNARLADTVPAAVEAKVTVNARLCPEAIVARNVSPLSLNSELSSHRIAVLHGGLIVELGTHDELLALNGYYSDLYNKQLLEEELAEV